MHVLLGSPHWILLKTKHAAFYQDSIYLSKAVLPGYEYGNFGQTYLVSSSFFLFFQNVALLVWGLVLFVAQII